MGHFLELIDLKKMKSIINSTFTSEGEQFVWEGKTVYKRDYIWLCLVNLKALGIVFSINNVKFFPPENIILTYKRKLHVP